MTEIIRQRIYEVRPDLSEKSVKTYVSLLWNMYKNIFDTGDIELDKFNDHETFLSYLQNFEPSRRKSYLASLTILTGNNNYRTSMLDDIKHYNDDVKKQEKNEKQQENWLTSEEINSFHEKYKIIADELFLKPIDELTSKEFQQIQNYIILCLTSGIYFQPRRSMDWTEMKISNFDLDTDNYIIRNKKHHKLYFNVYKTNKKYGQQSITLNDELKEILDKWHNLIQNKYPDCEWLFIDKNCNKLDPPKLNQRFEKIFGKKASTNILRHSYVSSKYKNIENFIQDSEAMGHNLHTHLLYYKK